MGYVFKLSALTSMRGRRGGGGGTDGEFSSSENPPASWRASTASRRASAALRSTSFVLISSVSSGIVVVAGKQNYAIFNQGLSTIISDLTMFFTSEDLKDGMVKNF